MSPLLSYLACLALGYALRLLHERYIQARREQVLTALGGELPEWEKRARALEDEADRDEIDGRDHTAHDERKKAARIRRVAMRRIRRGLPPAS
jgi:hypothetical protein